MEDKIKSGDIVEVKSTEHIKLKYRGLEGKVESIDKAGIVYVMFHDETVEGFPSEVLIKLKPYITGQDKSEARKVDAEFGNPVTVEQINEIWFYHQEYLDKEGGIPTAEERFTDIDKDLVSRILEVRNMSESDEEAWKKIEVEYYGKESISGFTFKDEKMIEAESKYQILEGKIIDYGGTEVDIEIVLYNTETNLYHIGPVSDVEAGTGYEFNGEEMDILISKFELGEEYTGAKVIIKQKIEEELEESKEKEHHDSDKSIIIEALDRYTKYWETYDETYWANRTRELKEKIESGSHVALNDKGECVYQQEKFDKNKDRKKKLNFKISILDTQPRDEYISFNELIHNFEHITYQEYKDIAIEYFSTDNIKEIEEYYEVIINK